MRKLAIVAVSSLALTACGGGGGGGSAGNVAVVPAPAPTPAPAPAPTPAPSPTPTPTPTPTSSYPTFASLTGDQTFETACASALTDKSPPTPSSATAFGDGLTLAFANTLSAYAVSGDGVDISFAAADRTSTSDRASVYTRVVDGASQRLAIAVPDVGGMTLSYARTLALDVSRAAGPTSYACVFGVPTKADDRPTAAFSFGKIGVAGTAYVLSDNGVLSTYTITSSTGTVAYDAATDAVTVAIQLSGVLQSAGSGATPVALGTFTGQAVIDRARGSYYGQLDSSDRLSLFSSFGGWTFGATEAAMAFEILSSDPAEGGRTSVVGTLVAVR